MEGGLPTTVPLSAITQPSTLLTAVLQQFSRKQSVDFSLLSLTCQLDPPSPPPPGSLLLSGLSVVGATWESSSRTLGDLGPQSPTLSPLPPLLLTPSAEAPAPGLYPCPVFRTPSRRGPDNLAMVVHLPVVGPLHSWVEGGVAIIIQKV